MSAPEYRNPYPGTAPFQDREQDRAVFFGRARETAQLTDIVLAESLVVLFARSGLGKSSLINAGLLERLRTNGCFPVVVRVTHSEEGPVESVFDRFQGELEKCNIKSEGQPDRSSLWSYFSGMALRTSEGRSLKPILVLDQFEELFTRIDPSAREDFIEQLADVANGRVPTALRRKALEQLDRLEGVKAIETTAEETQAEERSEPSPDTAKTDSKAEQLAFERERLLSLAYGGAPLDVTVIISIREDFLAELEALKIRIPLLFRHTMRLGPLTREQAREAIIKPSQQKALLGDQTVELEPEAVDAMLDFLSGRSVDRQLVGKDEIEPVLLQILCHSLFDRVHGRELRAITVSDLGGRRGMSRILRRYYNNVVRRFPRLRIGWNSQKWRLSATNLVLFNLPRFGIRRLCENGLILPNGFRNSLEGGFIGKSFGVPERDLTELVEQHLLRREPRMRGRFYELAHDSLVSILKANRFRRRVATVGVVAVAVLLTSYRNELSAIPAQLVLAAQLRPIKATILSDKNAQARQDALIRYGHLSRIINLSGDDLKNLRFDNTVVSPRILQVNFLNASLANCTFLLKGGGALRPPIFSLLDFKTRPLDPYSLVFRNATIRGSTFDGSTELFATFRNASIDQTSFKGVSFLIGDFSKSRLTDVDFTNASVRNVDFTGAKLKKVDFSGTPWWFAHGWSDAQVAQLNALFPQEAIAHSDPYLAEVKTRRARAEALRESGDTRGLALVLNDLAWFRAVHGVDLETAYKEVNESLKTLVGPPTLDTKAYILMQMGRYAEAKDILEQALGITGKTVDDAIPDLRGKSPGHVFRFALVLDLLGKTAEAKKVYAVTRYRPTHERILMLKLHHGTSN